jgi:hypothetical protein
MASEILGLFTSPQDYQMRQQQMGRNQALQFAQLDPFERANFGIYQGAQQLGGAAAGLFGMQDPQLKLISQRQMLSQEIDPSDPESILRVAQRASQLNDQPFALQLSDYARKMQSEIALTGQRTAQANKEYRQSIPNDLQITQERAKYNAALRELKALPPSEENTAKINYLNDVLAGLPLPGAAKPIDKIEINKQLTALRKEQSLLPPGPSPQREELQAQIDFLSGAKEEKANIKEIGVATGSNAPVYLDVNNDKQFIYTRDANGKQVRQDYIGGVDRTTARISQSVDQKGATAFVEKLAALDAKDVTDARALRDNSIAALNTLNDLAKLNDKGVITGTAASNRVSAANLLNSLGLVSEKDRNILANSENYQKTSGDLILKTLGGRLGAGFSNEDRKFIAGLIPQLENSAQARRELIERMQKVNEKIIKETTRLEDYAREKNSLKGFKPDIPLISPPRTGVQAMTVEEIKAEIARKKAQGK